MYCVKCGVRLQEGTKACPLCHTPVLLPEELQNDRELTYSDLFPKEKTHVRYLSLAFVTSIMIAVALVCFIMCINMYGEIAWSGYAMLGIALGWIWLVFPFWFPHRNPIIFSGVDLVALGGYLLYINCKSGGHWFLSFAFPLVGIVTLLICGVTALYRYVPGGRAFITGGFFILVGGCCILIEFFQHITFGSEMFVWSLYAVTVFAAIGLFFIIAGIIRPLRDFLHRKFFF